MRQKSLQLRMPGLATAFAILLLVLCVLVCPTKALARTPIAHSVDASGNVTDYYTPDDVEKKGPKAELRPKTWTP